MPIWWVYLCTGDSISFYQIVHTFHTAYGHRVPLSCISAY